MSFVEFRIFDGVSGELRPWLSWLEDCFVQENFTADEKLNLAQSLLAGEAESWFYRRQKTMIFQSWDELQDSLLLLFGDVADSDRIRLIAKRDRLLQEIREEARILRMKTTSLPAKDSIRETETEVVVPMDTIPITNWTESGDSILASTSPQEETYNPVLDGGAAFAKELITQCQVPNSSLEPGLRFSSEIIDISAAWPCAIVSKNPVHSQIGFESVKNTTNAHQVLDKTSAHKDRLKSKSKRMLSLSPKTWMFKFKTKNLHHAMDSNIFKSKRSSSRATCGYKWKEHNSRYGSRMRQTHISRLLCLYQTNAGKALEAVREIQSQQATVMRDGTKVSSLPAKALVHGDIVELRVGDKLPADMRDELFRMLHDPGGKKDEQCDEIFESEVDIGKVQRPQMGIVAESVITTPCLRESGTTVTGLLVIICVLANCLMHNSFALWHRWRRKASICALPLQISFYKLEDKLVFRRESIDTIHG